MCSYQVSGESNSFSFLPPGTGPCLKRMVNLLCDTLSRLVIRVLPLNYHSHIDPTIEIAGVFKRRKSYELLSGSG